MSDESRPHRPLSLTRRHLLRAGTIGGAAASLPVHRVLGALPARQSADLPDIERLTAIADALLPAELPSAERTGAAQALLVWLRGYREGETMDHGYGFTRIRETGPNPGPRYAADLDAMDAAARSRWGRPLAELEAVQVREIAQEAIDRIAPDLDSIPSRPDAPHVTIALLSAYYRSSVAADRAYEAHIRQETCRGLFTDVDGLQPWAPGVTDADREGRR